MKLEQGSGIGPRIVMVNDRLATLHPTQAEPVDYAEIDAIVERYRALRPAEALVLILQDLQRDHKYIPEPAMRLISERVGLPMVQIYGVATFYQDFSMQPRARFPINVCEGMSCYVRGADRIRRAIHRRLGIDYDENTPDGLFGVARADYCYGCCQLGPVVEINHEFYSHVTPESMVALIDRIEADQGRRTRDDGLGTKDEGRGGTVPEPVGDHGDAGPTDGRLTPPVAPPEPAAEHAAASPDVDRAPVGGDRVGEDATAHESQAAPPLPLTREPKERQIE